VASSLVEFDQVENTRLDAVSVEKAILDPFAFAAPDVQKLALISSYQKV
jgi:hypothetical protein